MREKLIKLLDGATEAFRFDSWENTDKIADFLIANGVAIPVQCKDCKFSEMCSIREVMGCTVPEGYCWRGERRTDGH